MLRREPQQQVRAALIGRDRSRGRGLRVSAC